MLERKRSLRSSACKRGKPTCEPRSAIRVDQARDAVELVVRGGRVPRTHHLVQLGTHGRGRRAQGHVLEQAMDRVPDLGAREPASARRTDAPRGDRGQPQDPFREVPVRAALEERERAVGQSADVVQWRRRRRVQHRQFEPDRGRAAWQLREERSCRASSTGGRRARRAPKRELAEPDPGRREAESAPRPSRARSGPPLQPPRSHEQSSRSSTQPIGVSRSAPARGSIAPETINRSIARVIAT